MPALQTTKADDIALVLEQAIVAGDIAPGTVLRQEQLSETYGVSRTPIREALRRLAALGLVSFEPNRGVRVRTLSRAEKRASAIAEGVSTTCPEAIASAMMPREIRERTSASSPSEKPLAIDHGPSSSPASDSSR